MIKLIPTNKMFCFPSMLFPFLCPSGLHVKETEDNEAVVSTVIDLHRLITSKHLPAVQGWVQVSTDKQCPALLTFCKHVVNYHNK